MNDNDEVTQHDLDIVKKACHQLMKHFDAVQIFATRHEGENTVAVKCGLGNWFARFGQVSLWVKSQVALESNDELKRNEE